MAQCDVAAANPTLLRVLAEGATRFLHHQVSFYLLLLSLTFNNRTI